MESSLSHDSVAGTALKEHQSIEATAALIGYNQQYLRRLLRSDRLESIKIGQVWTINLASLRGRLSQDQRYGPQKMIADSGKGVPARNASMSGRMLSSGQFAQGKRRPILAAAGRKPGGKGRTRRVPRHTPGSNYCF